MTTAMAFFCPNVVCVCPKKNDMISLLFSLFFFTFLEKKSTDDIMTLSFLAAIMYVSMGVKVFEFVVVLVKVPFL